MLKTTYKVTKMDCPSEENLIRTKLGGVASIKQLEFNLDKRLLMVFHEGDELEFEGLLASLGLGEQRLETVSVEEKEIPGEVSQSKALWIVLGINAAFFGIEMVSGLLSGSMGLVADSLDMLADAMVYGISLYAVGGTLSRKKQVAKLAGYFQLSLAILGFVEVLRRFFGVEGLPEFNTMIIVSVFALLGNVTCLYILKKSGGQKEAHIQASVIFTSNDVIINLGVIAAGLLVHWLQSGIPDLLIGSVVFLIVIRGAFRILKLAK